jgi:hypothetical protein
MIETSLTVLDLEADLVEPLSRRNPSGRTTLLTVDSTGRDADADQHHSSEGEVWAKFLSGIYASSTR